MKNKYTFLAVMCCVTMFENLTASDSGRVKPAGKSDPVVYSDFLVTVFRQPDGKHRAITACGDRDPVAEKLFDEKVERQKLKDALKKS